MKPLYHVATEDSKGQHLDIEVIAGLNEVSKYIERTKWADQFRVMEDKTFLFKIGTALLYKRMPNGTFDIKKVEI